MSITIITKIKLERACPVRGSPGWCCGKAGEKHSGTFNFLLPSAKCLALSDYFQDGGGLGMRVPDSPGTSPGTYSRGQGWERRVPVEHFPPEVSWCPTGIYEEGGAQITRFWGLCSQGSWPTAGHKQRVAKPLSPARLRGRAAVGRILGNEGPAAWW